ncbi:MAG: hypothetical protein J7L55_04835 [Desulfurococcales archaeon]|nr:hypothetical protein [Desulfurococcales archaeon]
MGEPLIFKGVEEQTLKRDELLNKLRTQIEWLEKGRVAFPEVMNTIHKLIRTRKVFMKYLEGTSSPRFEGEAAELMKTLLEFTLWVSIEDEIELLNRVKELAKVRDDATPKDEEVIKGEIKELELFKRKAQEFISRIG